MKISLLLNVFIGPVINGGAGKEGYELALDLYRRGVLGKVFCFGATQGVALPSSVLVPYCTNRIQSRALNVLSRATKRYPFLRGRRRIEQWIDAWFSRSLDAHCGDVLYCPKPLYPKTIKKANSLGIRTVVETSVFHPRFNLDVVSTERNRLGLRGAAGYTDSARVKNMEEALEHADRIFALSPSLRDSYIRYGVSESKMFGGAGGYKPPGIDLKRYSPRKVNQQEKFIVLHLSTITAIKGVQYLLAAWNKVADRILGELILVGELDKDMRKVLRRNRCNSVKWMGSSKNPQEFYQSASVFVSPSVSDAGPRTVLESMACGVPAIVSDRCGISVSLNSGHDGFVYHYNDVDRLSELIEWCYENRQQVRLMGENAYNVVKSYDVANYPADVWERINTVI